MEKKREVDDCSEAGHINGRNVLDPSVIQQLELEILKSMSVPGTDPMFRPGTDCSQGTIGNTSFTMESLTVESITTTATNESIEETGCLCCAKKQKPKVQESTPMEVGTNKSPLLLPPQSKEDKGKITLVLDLDETLVHSSFLAIPHADYRFILTIGQRPVGLFVCVRPGVDKFLKELGNLYEIVIFTASNQVYADAVINFIDKGKVVKHRLYRESCTDFNGNFVKDLARINRDLEKVIIVDNSNFSFMLQPYNAIPISTWIDDVTDNQIFVILDFLKKHYRCKNVYDILVDPVKNGIQPIKLHAANLQRSITNSTLNVKENPKTDNDNDDNKNNIIE